LPEALRGIEEWVRSAVRGEEPGRPTGEVVTALPNLGPEEQIGIYRHAWIARLVGCLEEDFPAVAHAVGAEAFHALARAYVLACPPRSWNIARAGDRFAAFVAAREGLAHREFLAELATLEWTVTSLLDREGPAPMDPAVLRDLPPERIAAARFRPAATAALLDFTYPVNAYFQAVRDGGKPAIPSPGPSAVAVFRAGAPGEERVWRHDLTPPMRAVLAGLFAGSTLEEAVGAAAEAPGADAEGLAEGIGGWFREWATGGVFGEAILPE